MKWARRHRALVGICVAALALTTVASVAGAALVWHEKEKTRIALAKAEIQRQRAETNFREAFWAIEYMLSAFDPNRSLGPVPVAEVKQYQTQESLRFLTAFCEQPSDDATVRLQQGAALVHIGRVYQVIAQRDKAHQAFEQAITVFGRLVKDFPDDPTYAKELGSALHILAENLYLTGRLRDANAYFSQIVSVFAEAVQKHPTDVESHRKLAECLCCWFDPKLRDVVAAVGLARKAVALAPDDRRSWLALGAATSRSGDWSGAVAALRHALQLKGGDWTGVQIACFLDMAEYRCGRQAQARESYQQAVRLMDRDFNARDLALVTSLSAPKPPPCYRSRNRRHRRRRRNRPAKSRIARARSRHEQAARPVCAPFLIMVP